MGNRRLRRLEPIRGRLPPAGLPEWIYHKGHEESQRTQRGFWLIGRLADWRGGGGGAPPPPRGGETPPPPPAHPPPNHPRPIGRRLRRLGCMTFPFACGSTPLIGSNRRNRRFPILAELCGPLCLCGCRAAMCHGFAGRALARVLWPWKVWRFAPHRRQGRRPGLSPLRLLQASKLPNFQASTGALCAPVSGATAQKKGPEGGPFCAESATLTWR